MDKHIETLNGMESSYAHIRKNDSEFEAIEAAKEALQEQAEREKGCEYCKGNALDDLVLTHDIAGSPRIALHGGNTPIDKDEKPVLCPHCGRYLGDKK